MQDPRFKPARHMLGRLSIVVAVACSVCLAQWSYRSRIARTGNFVAVLPAAQQARLRRQIEIVDALRAVERSQVLIGDELPMHMPASQEEWDQLIRLRKQRQSERGSPLVAP